MIWTLRYCIFYNTNFFVSFAQFVRPLLHSKNHGSSNWYLGKNKLKLQNNASSKLIFYVFWLPTTNSQVVYRAYLTQFLFLVFFTFFRAFCWFSMVTFACLLLLHLVPVKKLCLKQKKSTNKFLLQMNFCVFATVCDCKTNSKRDKKNRD